MGVAVVPVDLTNPGQVFACLGFVEAAGALLGDAVGGFDWAEPEPVRFRLTSSGDEDPVARVLRFLALLKRVWVGVVAISGSGRRGAESGDWPAGQSTWPAAEAMVTGGSGVAAWRPACRRGPRVLLPPVAVQWSQLYGPCAPASTPRRGRPGRR